MRLTVSGKASFHTTPNADLEATTLAVPWLVNVKLVHKRKTIVGLLLESLVPKENNSCTYLKLYYDTHTMIQGRKTVCQFIRKYSRRGNRPSQPYVGDLLLHTYISTEIHLRVAFPEAHSRIHFRYHTFAAKLDSISLSHRRLTRS